MDVPLSGEGRLGAALAADKLKQYSPKVVYSSDLGRDTETAHIISGRLQIPKEAGDFSLRTWDVGIYAGKLESEATEAVEYFYRNPWLTPPGSSESFNGFAERFRSYIDNKLNLASQVEAFRPSVFVAHGRNLAMMDSYLNGKETWEAEMPMPAGIALIKVGSDRSLSLEIPGESECVLADV